MVVGGKEGGGVLCNFRCDSFNGGVIVSLLFWAATAEQAGYCCRLCSCSQTSVTDKLLCNYFHELCFFGERVRKLSLERKARLGGIVSVGYCGRVWVWQCHHFRAVKTDPRLHFVFGKIGNVFLLPFGTPFEDSLEMRTMNLPVKEISFTVFTRLKKC